MDNAATAIQAMLPSILALGAAVVSLVILDRLLLRGKPDRGGEGNLPRQLLLLAATALAVVFVVLTLPIADSTRNQLLALFGLALTALIGLASTTFVANAMAGIMLRSVNNFRPGDFVRVGDNFGRVTERGLFHTEVQTEDSDLTTLPNLLLVSSPVTVIRSQGTIVSASVSLGYDNAHTEVEPILLDAAASAQLEKPFVQVLELNDHTVTYRVAGFLAEVKWLITARSNLRKSILDKLHAARIEIASPTLVNQRRSPADEPILPAPGPAGAIMEEDLRAAPEEILFDKAEAAERVEDLRKHRDLLVKEIAELREQLKGADITQRAGLEQRLVGREAQLATLDERLQALETEPS